MDQLVKGTVKDAPLLVVGLVDTELVRRATELHDTFPTASAAFGRSLSGALLLASVLKEGQRVILQLSGDGPLKSVVAEADWAGRARGYVRRPHIHLGPRDGKLDVGRAIGAGTLNVIRDLGLRQQYQSSVPLQTGEIASDLAYYLQTSEQVPSAVSLGVFVDTDNAVKASGGFMIQVMPGADDETLSYLEGRLPAVRPVSEMIRDGLGAEDIVREAVGLPLEIGERKVPDWFCPCTRERVLAALSTLGPKDIEELSEKGEAVEVRCEFCKAEYFVTPEELHALPRSRPPAGNGHGGDGHAGNGADGRDRS